MFIVWLIVVSIMVLLYWYFEWKLIRIATKRLYTKEKAFLPGKRWYYSLGTFLITFVGVSAFYFAITNFTRSEVVSGCWLAPSLIIGLLTAFSTFQRLRFLVLRQE